MNRRRAINAVIYGIAFGLGTTAIDALFGLDAVPWPLSIVLATLLGGGAYYAASGMSLNSNN